MSAVSSTPGAPEGALALLAQAALAPRDQALKAWRTWRRQYDIDTTPWNEVRMLGAVAARLDWLEPDASIRPRIQGIRKFLWVQSQICLERAVGGLSTLNRAGIPLLLMKGTARIAGDPKSAQERLIRDVDVLVPLGDHDEAFAALEADGWALVEDGWQTDWRKLGTVAAHHAWSLRKGKSEIDLHHFSNHLNRLAGDDDGLWERARPIDWKGIPVRVPCPADALLIALVHGVRWSRDRAADWTVDACALLDESGVDWNVFVKEAKARLLQAVLLAGLRYLTNVLQREVPRAAIAALESGATRRQNDELHYYSRHPLPRSVGDVKAAWTMAGFRALLRAGMLAKMSAPRSPLNVIERSFGNLAAGQMICWFAVPRSATADWLVARVELAFPLAKANEPVIGQFRAPGLDFGTMLASIRKSEPNTLTAAFQIEIPKALLALRQIEILSFQHVITDQQAEVDFDRPLRIEWLGSSLHGARQHA